MTQSLSERQKRQLQTLELWSNEVKIINKADQPIENKGIYMIWREYLLLKKSAQGKLSLEGATSRTGDYNAHRQTALNRKIAPKITGMRKSISADALNDLSSLFHSETSQWKPKHQRRTSLSLAPSIAEQLRVTPPRVAGLIDPLRVTPPKISVQPPTQSQSTDNLRVTTPSRSHRGSLPVWEPKQGVSSPLNLLVGLTRGSLPVQDHPTPPVIPEKPKKPPRPRASRGRGRGRGRGRAPADEKEAPPSLAKSNSHHELTKRSSSSQFSDSDEESHSQSLGAYPVNSKQSTEGLTDKKKSSENVPSMSIPKDLPGYVPPPSGSPDLIPVAKAVPPPKKEKPTIVYSETQVTKIYAFTGMHHIFVEHTQAVTSIAFAHHSREICAFASADGTLSICQVLPQPKLLRKLQGHTDGITHFSWSPTNEYIVTTSLDHSVRVWTARNADCIRLIKDGGLCHCSLFLPTNDNLFFYGTDKGLIKSVDLKAAKVVEKVRVASAVLCLEFTPQGDFLFVGDKKGIIYTFTCSNGALKLIARSQVSNRASIHAMSYKYFSSDSHGYLLVNTNDSTLKLFRVESEVSSNGNNLILERQMPVLNTKEKDVIRSRFCPGLDMLGHVLVVSGSEEGSVLIFDAMREYPVCINKLQGHAGVVFDVCWNADETLLASCDESGMVILWKRTVISN